MSEFDAFFRAATGSRPYGYQARIAHAGLPGLLRAPVGSGKTAAVVLAWLWRRLHGPDQAGTPRRLMYVLPARSLPGPLLTQLRSWLGNLDLTDEVAVHAVRGSRSESTGDWRENPHQPAIIVGDADLLVSKALNRAYGTGRAVYPIDFALAVNGAHWIVDELALCPRPAATLRQLAGLAAGLGTAEPFGLTCCTAVDEASPPATPEAKPPAGPPLAPGADVTVDAGLAVRAGPVPQPAPVTEPAPVPQPAPVTQAGPVPQAAPATETGPAGGSGPVTETGALAVRLTATRTVRRAPLPPGDYPALAAFAGSVHRPGTLTLVTLNEVAAAQQVGRLLEAGPVRSALLHAQLRGTERAAVLAGIAADPAGLIVVCAGEAASALDLTAATVLTEAAPWPSLVARAGRANRAGRLPDAALWWLPPPSPGQPVGPPAEQSAEQPAGDPAEQAAVEAACAGLTRLEGMPVTVRDLLVCPAPAVPAGQDALAVPAQGAPAGRPELADLFDTWPVPAGPSAAVDSCLRDAGEPDLEVAWATWTAGPGGAPDPEVRYPAPEYRCRVPAGAVVSLAATRPVWRFDQAAWQWRRFTGQPPAEPYDLLLVNAVDGGYDLQAGFDPAARTAVPDCPELLTPAELAEQTAAFNPAGVAATAGQSGGELAPPAAARNWQSLTEHSEQVRDQAAALLAVLGPALPEAAPPAAVLAAYLHDTGKAHPIWQDALCALATEADAAMVAAGRPWAKSGTTGRLEFASGVHFRHELASLLLIDGPLHPLLTASPDPDLTRYLVLAHHGLLRVQVREPDGPPPLPPGPPPLPGRGETPAETTAEPAAAKTAIPEPAASVLLGLVQGAVTSIPPVLGQPAATLTVDTTQFRPASEGSPATGRPAIDSPARESPAAGRPVSGSPAAAPRSWAETVAALLDRYGPFILAYLEAIVRIADWRASGGRELP